MPAAAYRMQYVFDLGVRHRLIPRFFFAAPSSKCTGNLFCRGWPYIYMNRRCLHPYSPYREDRHNESFAFSPNFIAGDCIHSANASSHFCAYHAIRASRATVSFDVSLRFRACTLLKHLSNKNIQQFHSYRVKYTMILLLQHDADMRIPAPADAMPTGANGPIWRRADENVRDPSFVHGDACAQLPHTRFSMPYINDTQILM